MLRDTPFLALSHRAGDKRQPPDKTAPMADADGPHGRPLDQSESVNVGYPMRHAIYPLAHAIAPWCQYYGRIKLPPKGAFDGKIPALALTHQPIETRK
jgi:hypothetical protein